MMLPRCLVLALAVAPAAPAQSITWLEGAAANTTLKTVPENAPTSPATTVLSNLELLDIEITGRTLAQEVDPTRSRRLQHRGVTRVELPGGHRLLAYRRNNAQTYGYLTVRNDGRVVQLFERAAVGAQSPFADRLAVSADGSFAAVDTMDGALHILRLDGSSFQSTGTPRRVVRMTAAAETATLRIGRTHLFCGSEDERVWRCALADGANPEDVSPPAIANARLGSEFVLSDDGSTIAFRYGVRGSERLWLVRETSGAVQLPPRQSSYEDPGYLPEATGGPRMMLNHDGSRLLYTETAIRDEIFVLDTSGQTVPTQITGDHNFVPYIGIGIFPAFAGAFAVLGVGDPGRFDVYVAATGDLPVANLTQTAGNVTRPWQPGGLVPQGMSLSGGGAILLTEGAQTSAMRSFRIDPTTSVSVQVADQLTELPRMGTGPGTPDLELSSTNGDLLLDANVLAPVLQAPAGVRLHDSLHLRGGWRVLVAAAAGNSALVFRASGGALLPLPMVAGDLNLALTPSGNLLLTGTQLQMVGAGGLFTVPTTGAVRLLSGAGS